MWTAALDIVFAPLWICLALSIYSLTLGGIVWRLMVGTILICAIIVVGFTIVSYLENSNIWTLPAVIGGPVTLACLLVLWYFRLKGDPLINSNSWRMAMVYLVPMGIMLSLMVVYKIYLMSREENCKEICIASEQEYEFNMRTRECRCYSESDYTGKRFKNY